MQNKTVAHKTTPLVPYNGPSAGWHKIWLKDETCQESGAFKYRGVAFKAGKMLTGSSITTASTGNHGIATAIAALKLDLKVIIFIPRHTASVKKQKLRHYKAEVVAVDGEYQTCVALAKKHAAEHGAVFIHGFDDAEIIEGNRSIFKEMKSQLSDIPALFIPVGGGGLLSACLKEFPVSDHRIVAVELDHAPSLKLSLEKGERVKLEKLRGKADGMMVDMVGETVFSACREQPVQIQTISEADLEEAIKLLWKYNGIRAELSGASALAAALKASGSEGECVCIVSGGNINEAYFQSITDDEV